MVIYREEPGAGLAAKWVSVSNGHMWRGASGGPVCQVGKFQQWLYTERSPGRAWLPSGQVSAMVTRVEEIKTGLAASWVNVGAG